MFGTGGTGAAGGFGGFGGFGGAAGAGGAGAGGGGGFGRGGGGGFGKPAGGGFGAGAMLFGAALPSGGQEEGAQDYDADGGGGEEEEVFDEDAARRAALAAMPQFLGYTPAHEYLHAGSGPALVGTCELMCPVAERKRRETSGELNIFERCDPLNTKLTHESLIIKKALLAAPDEAQLAAATHQTPAQCLLAVQAFLWDRYREVRKEIIAQHFHTRPDLLPEVLAWNEEIARFLIISSHELWGKEGFSAQLNQEQLKKVLTDLVTRFYPAAAKHGLPTPCSAEMKCYLLVLMVGGTIEKNGRRFRQRQEAMQYVRQYTQEEQASDWTRALYALLPLLERGDALGVFGFLARAPYTLAARDVSFPHLMSSKAPKQTSQAWITAKRSPLARNADCPSARPQTAKAIEEAVTSACLRSLQLEAAAWLRARLSCGRSAGPRPQRRQLPGGLGEVLTLAPVAAALAPADNGRGGRAEAWDFTLCVEDEALAAGASHEEAAAEAAQDLAESWQRLRAVLACLPPATAAHQADPAQQPPQLAASESDAAPACWSPDHGLFGDYSGAGGVGRPATAGASAGATAGAAAGQEGDVKRQGWEVLQRLNAVLKRQA
eukprot:XP_001694862.1 predicted protein [Chlamydomonas reinhardtii]